MIYVLIAGVWFYSIAVAASGKAAEQDRRGVPPEARTGISGGAAFGMTLVMWLLVSVLGGAGYEGAVRLIAWGHFGLALVLTVQVLRATARR